MDNNSQPPNMPLPGSLLYKTTIDLRGKQSVRATFKLSERTIRAVQIIANHMGIKQKSLFDYLMDDLQTLDMISGLTGKAKMMEKQRVQKTYVISRKALNYLEKIAERYEAPRDILIEFSVKRLLPILRQEKEKQEKRKAALQELKRHQANGEKILNKYEILLGPEDPLCEYLANALSAGENTCRQAEEIVAKGKIIEQFYELYER